MNHGKTSFLAIWFCLGNFSSRQQFVSTTPNLGSETWMNDFESYTGAITLPRRLSTICSTWSYNDLHDHGLLAQIDRLPSMDDFSADSQSVAIALSTTYGARLIDLC